jgi:hypothetical protein
MAAATPQHDMLRATALLGGFFFVLAFGAYFATMQWSGTVPRDSHGLIAGRDYLNFWMYGRAAHETDPGRYYDLQTYNDTLGKLFGVPWLGVNWSYPPTVMIPGYFFAKLGYIPSLLVWTALGYALYAWLVLRHAADRFFAMAALAAPAAIICVMSGQFAFFTTAALIGIFYFRDTRPVLAGILAGVLTLKPQLGIFLPIMLIAGGYWRIIMVAGITAIAIAAASAAFFGVEVWRQFVELGIPTQNRVLSDPAKTGAPYMPTIFMNLRLVGFNYGGAMLVQAVAGVIAALTLFWAFRYRREADPLALMALFFACSVFGTPYMLVYDTLPLAFAALLLLQAGRTNAVGTRLVQLVYWLPLLQIGFGYLGLPGPALIAPAFAAWLAVNLRKNG